MAQAWVSALPHSPSPLPHAMIIGSSTGPLHLPNPFSFYTAPIYLLHPFFMFYRPIFIFCTPPQYEKQSVAQNSNFAQEVAQVCVCAIFYSSFVLQQEFRPQFLHLCDLFVSENKNSTYKIRGKTEALCLNIGHWSKVLIRLKLIVFMKNLSFFEKTCMYCLWKPGCIQARGI